MFLWWSFLEEITEEWNLGNCRASILSVADEQSVSPSRSGWKLTLSITDVEARRGEKLAPC